MSHRRRFLQKISTVAAPFVSPKAAFFGVAAAAATPTVENSAARTNDPWAQMEIVPRRIKPPTFPPGDFDITKVGNARAQHQFAAGKPESSGRIIL